MEDHEGDDDRLRGGAMTPLIPVVRTLTIGGRPFVVMSLSGGLEMALGGGATEAEAKQYALLFAERLTLAIKALRP